MKLKKVQGFQSEYDIAIRREGEKVRLTVTCNEKVVFDKPVKNGSTNRIVM